ncbi:MAG: Flp pilus assembly protein CpaB [Moorellaceae bacterium]
MKVEVAKLRLKSLSVKKNMPTVMSFIFALAAALLVYTALNAARPTEVVVVAVRTIPVGEAIRPDDVAVKNLPPVAIPATAVRRPTEAVGRTVVAGPIIAGDIVRAEHLSTAGSLAATLQTFAPPGWVAVELPQNTSTAMSGLRRGDRVDVYGETLVPQGTTVAKVAEGAVILATPWSGTSVGGQNATEGPKQYIVAVPPDKAPAIATMTVLNKKATLVLPPSSANPAPPAVAAQQ